MRQISSSTQRRLYGCLRGSGAWVGLLLGLLVLPAQAVSLHGRLELVPGLNLVGLPVDPVQIPDVASLLTALGDAATIRQVWRFAPLTQHFERCGYDANGNPVGSGCAAPATAGEGWLVEVLTATEVVYTVDLPCPGLDLLPGFHLVAFPCVGTLGAQALLPLLGGAAAVASLQELDVVTGRWRTTTSQADGAAAHDFPIVPGKAYVLSVRTPTGLSDPDFDGLSNDEETARGTDLHDPDSDGDSFTDGDEVAAESNPLDATDTPAGTLPPDPAEVAPPADLTVATTVYDSTAFLYTGAHPMQTGVAEGTIEPRRAAVVRGRVLDRHGHPLAGVTLMVLDHPELGQTLSRTDGRFDLAVNGGGRLTVHYRRNAYLPAQRQVSVPWRDFVRLDDVVMLPVDAQVTAVDLSGATDMQVARGSLSMDSDGARQATVLFPQGTQAEMVLPDGSTQPLGTLQVRATEYTVGDRGPEAMPAKLPPTSGYTYAVELSADEALAAGAVQVRFNQPLPFYIENFLSFPVGGIVPTGYYDRMRGVWVASNNGRIVEILSVTGGMAVLDVDGSGQAADAQALAELGITDAERRRLVELYTPGQSLWRVSIPHFTPWDHNWPYGPPDDAEPPPPPMPEQPEEDPCEQSGSIIECQNQILGERIPVVGTPYTLNYRSNRVPGYEIANILRIPLSNAGVPDSVYEIRLRGTIAGRTFEERLIPAPNQVTSLTWDGRDAYNRTLRSPQRITIELCYAYPAVYRDPADFARSFARVSGASSINRIIDISARTGIEVCQTSGGELTQTLGIFDARNLNLGGWSLSVHHVYDPVRRMLYRGDGGRRNARSLGDLIITTVAGRPIQGGYSGDGGPATEALIRPGDVALAADGNLYITEPANSTIRRVDPNGIITTFAARLSNPGGIDVGPDGSVYFADQFSRVRRIDPNGIIDTVAGTGDFDFTGDNGPATEAHMRVADVAVAPDGGFYIADNVFHRVRYVGADGLINTIAGTGVAGFSGDGGPAIQAELNGPSHITLGPDGSLYIADSGNRRVRRVGQDGIITTVAGGGAGGGSGGDGGPATDATFSVVRDLAVGSGGVLYIADNRRIRRVTPDGLITTVAGAEFFGFQGDNGPATSGRITATGIAVGPDGNLYVADPGPATSSNRVRRIQNRLPGFSGGEIIIAADTAPEVYGFDAQGRHLRTTHAITGEVLHSFGYDGQGRLITVTDGDGNVTTIERDMDGNPTAVVAPFGQRTTLSLDGDGYLQRVVNPAAETYRMVYDGSSGLLTAFTDPRNNTAQAHYDADGRLLRDDDAADGFTTLTRATTAAGFQVTKNTALDRTTVFQTEVLLEGGKRTIITRPSGTQTEARTENAGSQTLNFPDGSMISWTDGPDPRWGMHSPLRTDYSFRMPSGLTYRETVGRSVELADPNDLSSLIRLIDTIAINTRTYTRAYDAATRTYTLTGPAGRESHYTVDDQGRLARIQGPGVFPIDFGYDDQGRVFEIVQGSGLEERRYTFGYGSDGRMNSITDALSHTGTFIRDEAGRVTMATLADGRQIQVDYDDHGKITAITPAGKPTHRFDYTPLGQQASYVAPDVGAGSSTTLASYNADGQLELITRPDGRTIDYGYDSAGRLATIDVARGRVTRTYNSVTGLLATLTAPDGGMLSFTYDGQLLTGTAWTGTVTGNVTRTYNNDFRLASRRVNGIHRIDLQYSVDGLLLQAGDLTLQRDAGSGFLMGTTLGAITTSRSYDSFGSLASAGAAWNGTDFYGVQYTRDALARVTEKTETVLGVTNSFQYDYDLTGRLVEVRQNGAVIAQYTYDDNGNRLTQTDVDGTVTGTYDAQDRLLSYGSTTYAYTANGELESKTEGGQTTLYEYDELGNLLAVDLPHGAHIDYLLDASNRRIGKRIDGVLVQGFLYKDGLNPIAELDGSNTVVSRFVYGSRPTVPDYLIRDGMRYQIIADRLGSPRLVVEESTGTVVQRLDYDAFGNVLQDSNPGFQPFGFSGGLYDSATGLVRLGTRDYDPRTGRWTAKDRLGFIQGTNLYAYVNNDPVSFIDPAGTGPWFPPLDSPFDPETATPLRPEETLDPLEPTRTGGNTTPSRPELTPGSPGVSPIPEGFDPSEDITHDTEPNICPGENWTPEDAYADTDPGRERSEENNDDKDKNFDADEWMETHCFGGVCSEQPVVYIPLLPIFGAGALLGGAMEGLGGMAPALAPAL